MKPKTKIQKIVSMLSKELASLTDNQINYADSKLFKKQCFRTKNTAFCLECGSSIDVKEISKYRVVCCSCGNKLKVTHSKNRTFNTPAYYFSVASVIKYGDYDFQIVRNFELTKEYKKGFKAKLNVKEVTQYWNNIDGTEVIISRLLCNYYSNNFQGNLEIRKPSNYKTYNIQPHLYCSTSKFRKDYAQKGISHKISNISLKNMVEKLNYTQVETLLKAGYYDIIYNWSISEIINHWNSLKICIRNNYKIFDASSYLDLLNALKFLNKDIRNSFFVCPKNFKASHDYFIKKKNEIQVGREIAKNIEKAKELNPKYVKEKKKFFDLKFNEKKIEIIPLKSVPEFLSEGEKLKHCVYRSDYFKKKNSLILSARIEGEPIETIEVSLDHFKIIQAHGFKNKPSKHHEKVVNIVNKNINRIKELCI